MAVTEWAASATLNKICLLRPCRFANIPITASPLAVDRREEPIFVPVGGIDLLSQIVL